MTRSMLSLSLVVVIAGAAGCGGGDDPELTPDAHDPPQPDAPPSGCDPLTALPTNYRPIPTPSTGAVQVTTTAGITSGTIDATAGGLSGAADNPYIYVDLATGAKVDVSDLDARSSTAWDIALKRSSLRINGGDSGPGGRTLAIVPAGSLAEVTAAPPAGYTTDDFTDADCELVSLPGGEPMSAFGEWYAYNDQTHAVTPKPQVYVIDRGGGARIALWVASYYGDPSSPMRGAYYRVEWKPL
ncbi:MAG: HmuY family protein [Kofleriaceae bacterium]